MHGTNTAAVSRPAVSSARIPASRLYAPGIAVLNQYPLPNVAADAGHELQLRDSGAARSDNLTQQPAIRLDYQLSSKLRFTGKYSGQRAAKLDDARHDSGLQRRADTRIRSSRTTRLTVNYTINPTTFLEGTYGFIRNELAERQRTGGILMNDVVEPPEEPAGLPAAVSGRGRGRSATTTRYEVMDDVKPPFWDGTRINLPPVFAWGSRIGAAPPQPALSRAG